MSTYNGWKNYETWAVKLWIDNDQGQQEFYDEQAEQVLKRARKTQVLTKQEAAIYEFANMLKADHKANMPEVNGVWSDLLQSAIDSVSWDEISRSIIESLDERK